MKTRKAAGLVWKMGETYEDDYGRPEFVMWHFDRGKRVHILLNEYGDGSCEIECYLDASQTLWQLRDAVFHHDCHLKDFEQAATCAKEWLRSLRDITNRELTRKEKEIEVERKELLESIRLAEKEIRKGVKK